MCRMPFPCTSLRVKRPPLRDAAPTEILYCKLHNKLHKTQIPVIEQALEIAALMLGSDKARGHCVENICADFLAGEPGERQPGNPAQFDDPLLQVPP